MTTMTAAAPSASTAPFTRLLGYAFAGGAAAAVVNLVLLFGAGAAGVAFTGEFQPGTVAPLGAGPVVMASLVPAFFGTLVAFAIQKFTKSAARVFAIVAGVFTLLSLGGPANVAQLGTGALVVMELMHVVAAVGIGGGLWKALKS